MGNPLSIIIDPAQARLSRDAISTLVSGRDWSPTSFQDIWVDPITNTCMLRPGPQYPAWATSNTGIFTKLFLSDFTLTDSGNWPSAGQQVDQGGPFMFYAGPSGNVSGLLGYTANQLVNQPMVLEYFQQGTTNAPYGILDFGWGSSHDYTTGVSCRLYGDGRADLWKGGYQVGTYSVGGSATDYFSSSFTQATQLGGGVVAAQQPSRYTTLMLIPCRDRELLVVSNQGGGFCHIFEDLAEQVPGLTITPNAPFWFYVQPNVLANVRISKLQYASSGHVCGIPSNWRNAPPGSGEKFVIFESLSQQVGTWGGSPIADMATATTVVPPTNPYSVPNPIQIRLDLTAGSPLANNWTPFIYGARAYYPSATANTGTPDGGGIELLPYVLEAHIDASDTIGSTKASLKLMQPAAMAAAGVVDIEKMCNRALQFSDSVGMFLNGVTEPPHFTDSSGFDADSLDRNQDVDIDVRDIMKLCEEYIFSDPIPLDGMSLFDAYVLVANTIGIPGNGHGAGGPLYVSPSAQSFLLPEAGAPSGGDWNVLVDVGDKGSDWLDRLAQTYAGNWYHGFRPDRATPSNPPLLSLIDPADTTANYRLPATTYVTLYKTIDDAVAAGYSRDVAYKYVYRNYKVQYLEPEANDVWITGMDFRTRKPIIAHRGDAASQDPTTAPALRPDNWLGTIRKYAWVDPTITTMDLATAVLELLYPRVTIRRCIVEFEAEYQDGMWRGDNVILDGASVEGNLRVKTFNGSFENVAKMGDSMTYDNVWRPCRYVAETGNVVAPLDVPGSSLKQLAANWNMLKAISKQIVFQGGQMITRRPILNQQEV